MGTELRKPLGEKTTKEAIKMKLRGKKVMRI